MAIKGVPETMQAVQIVEFNKPHELREIPTPTKLGPHDLLVKIAVASLCHSDLEYQAGAIRGSTLPVIASHEGCGIVAAVGDAVTNFKIGDRVLAGQTYGRCGECDDCNGPENYKHYCGVAWASPMGGGRNGAFSDYHITDARESTHLPDNVSFETAAPLACAGITVWRAVLQTELEPESGKWIGIVGSGGGLGHIGIQFAKARGLKVVAIDASDNGIALSKEMGADVVIDARLGKDAVVQKVMEVTNRQGVDASTCLTDAKVAPSVSCGITKRHGIMVQIAVSKDVSIPFEEYLFRDIRVKGSLICSQKECEEMLEVVAKHNIKVKTNLYHGLDSVTTAIDDLRNARYMGKGVIIVDEEAVNKQPRSHL